MKTQSRKTKRFFFLALVFLAACFAGLFYFGLKSAVKPLETPESALVPFEGSFLFEDDGDPEPFLLSLRESIARLEIQPDKLLSFGKRAVRSADVLAQLRQVARWVEEGVQGRELMERIASISQMHQSAAGEGGVLFTGYYEAFLEGDRVRQGPYQTPLYRRPAAMISVDLGLFFEEFKGRNLAGLLDGKRLLPLPDRSAMAEGALKGEELLWVSDPVEAFFLEIQGSGQVRMPDGSSVRVGYAGSNGHPYKAIGTLLIREGKIPKEQMSRLALQEYLRAHPEEQRRIFDFNPSVVFFELRDRGPVGSSGAVVTAGRSIATDRKLFPEGALAMVVTTRPVLDEKGQRVGQKPLVRLVLNQDTGGAIKGAGRVDLFWGAGEIAATEAGHFKDQGSLYFFAPRTSAPL